MKTKLLLSAMLLSSASLANDMSWIYEDKTVGEAKKENLPKHNCPVPIKIRVLNDNRDVRRINETNRKFNNCINDFVRSQEKKIKNAKDLKTKNIHSRAINQAIVEANKYMNEQVEQNQHYGGHKTKLDGLGYDRDREEEKLKLEDMKKK